MLARFFQKSEPISFVSLLLLLFIYVFIQSFSNLTSEINLWDVLQFFGNFVFVSAFVFLSSFIIRKNYLTPANYYAIFILVILFGLFPTSLGFSKISLSHFFVLLAARRIYSIRSKKTLLSKFFDSGFYIGIAFLLYPVSGIYLLLIYISNFIYIRVINKDLLIPILGFLTPVFLAFTYYFFNDEIGNFKNMTEINLSFDYKNFADKSLYIPLISIMLLLSWALIKIFNNSRSLNNEEKNNSILVLNHLIITLFIFAIVNINIETNIQFLFLPTVILIGNLLVLIKKTWLKEIILYGILILSFMLPFI